MAEFPVTDASLRFGAALRAALGGRSQTEFGAEVARCEGRSDRYSQSQVSDWVRGKEPSPMQVFAIEKALGLRAGILSRLLGYLPTSARSIVTVTDALAGDTALDEASRAALIATYRSLARPKK